MRRVLLSFSLSLKLGLDRRFHSKRRALNSFRCRKTRTKRVCVKPARAPRRRRPSLNVVVPKSLKHFRKLKKVDTFSSSSSGSQKRRRRRYTPPPPPPGFGVSSFSRETRQSFGWTLHRERKKKEGLLSSSSSSSTRRKPSHVKVLSLSSLSKDV